MEKDSYTEKVLSRFASVMHLDESNFDQAIRESPVPVLVDFGLPGAALAV
jgi:hypothetical protein